MIDSKKDIENAYPILHVANFEIPRYETLESEDRANSKIGPSTSCTTIR